MTVGIRAAVRTDVGHVRSDNEDAAYAGSRLLAVADGMGGAAAGEVASHVAISALAPLDDDAPGSDMLGALHDAVMDADDRLRDLVAGDAALTGMGTTVTALLAAGTRIAIAHLGDSRAYLLRDGELRQITHDHTFVQALVDAGDLAPDEAASHPKRSLLLRSLQGTGDVDLDLSVREARIGDRYLLCTDGLSGVVTADTMAETLTAKTPAEAADRLVSLALRAGGPDNVTVIVADVVSSDSPVSAGLPQVVGSAAMHPAGAALPGGAASNGTAAARAARLGRRPSTAALVETEPVRRNGLRQVAAALVGALIVAILGGVGSVFYLRHQWYVGVDHGRVAILHGVPGRVLGVGLHTVDERYGSVSDLAAVDAADVQKGIPASDEAQAKLIVSRLLPSTPAATDTAVPGATPGAGANPSASASPEDTAPVTGPTGDATPSIPS